MSHLTNVKETLDGPGQAADLTTPDNPNTFNELSQQQPAAGEPASVAGGSVSLTKANLTAANDSDTPPITFECCYTPAPRKDHPFARGGDSEAYAAMEWGPRTLTLGDLASMLQHPAIAQGVTLGQIDQWRAEAANEGAGPRIRHSAKVALSWPKTCGGLMLFGTLLGNGGGDSKKNENALSRCMVALDLDHMTPEQGDRLLSDLLPKVPFRYALHATFSHRPESPRLRMIVPLSEPITADEFGRCAKGSKQSIKTAYALACAACAEKVFHGEQAAFGFDPASMKLVQGMCMPVLPDNAPECEAEYAKWLRCTLLDDSRPLYSWRSAVESGLAATGGKRKKKADGPYREHDLFAEAAEADARRDPRAEPGMHGAFCRTYDVPAAIAKFIPDRYEQEGPDRYHLVGCDASGGAHVIEGGLKIHIHNTGDPLFGRTVDAFELVAIWRHLNPANSLAIDNAARVKEAYAAFATECKNDPAINAQMEQDGSLLASLLQRDDYGQPKRTTANAAEILRHAKRFSRIGFDLFRHQITIKDIRKDGRWSIRQWSDYDTAWVREQISGTWGFEPCAGLDALIGRVAQERNAYDPLLQRLERCPASMWDGTPRIRTIFTDLLGAANSEVNRCIACAFFLDLMCAGLNDPDWRPKTMLLLVGPQGIGKSHFFETLAGEFHGTTTFAQIADGEGGKKCIECNLGSWIIEAGEMSRFSAEAQAEIKQFITTNPHYLRMPYDRHRTQVRQRFVLVGSSNMLNDGVLLDTTGNRRYLPVVCSGRPEGSEFGPDDVPQLLAEARDMYDRGERSDDYLIGIQSQLNALRDQMMAKSDYFEDIEAYVNREFPDNWERLADGDRRAFLDGTWGTGNANWNCPWAGRPLAKRDWFPTKEIQVYALQVMPGREPRGIKARIRGDMQRLGFVTDPNPRRFAVNCGCATPCRGFMRKVPSK